ncbi:IS200/IS605 family transposase [Micromonospora sp. 4G57]|uniref:IS200/IS605 family transposase n=1 Tax=Micromonospora sicca TaxID=2202420 RepID=A0ABU5JGZ4_9ACTN|nr:MULTISPECIES: IS200/IS605 family transposase [unclassified Micromonospora]MDZ5444007.1 IS200/IS605 family transposase [Micromonospora sp. 4G57]MDZ5491866.1 IS200/IS605 family transposase [Micromonospora sp. 4G53]
MSPRWTADPNIRRGRSIVHDLHAHLVFVTKYRRGVLDEAMLARCEQVMTDVCASMEAELAEFNGEDDHVHLLVRYPPKLAISTLVNSLKGVSAHYLRKEFTGQINRHLIHGHLWSPSYFAASCGGAPLAIVKDYIDRQKCPE